MSILFETIHGDITIDLLINDDVISPQIHNIINLTEMEFFSKLSTFIEPKLHFKYSSENFLFLGDPTYSGKGGQSSFFLLNSLKKQSSITFHSTSFKPISTTHITGSLLAQQQFLSQRRDNIRAMTTPNQPPNQPPQIFLLSIPLTSGEVSSLFAFYITQPLTNSYLQNYQEQSNSDNVMGDKIPAPIERTTLPEYLLDYVIGTIIEGSEVIHQLYRCSLPNPLLGESEKNHNKFSMEIKHNFNRLFPKQSTHPATTTQNIKNGNIISQCGVIYSPYQPISKDLLSLLYFQHQDQKIMTKYQQKQKNYQNVDNTNNNNNNGDDDYREGDEIFLDNFVYNPKLQHSPYFLHSNLDGTDSHNSKDHLAVSKLPNSSLDDDENDNEDVLIQIAMEEPKNALFLSNLNPSTTKEDIIQHLSQYASVIHCNIVKENMSGNANKNNELFRCFAFVSVATESQCDLVVKSLNKSVMNKYTINVDWSHSDSNVRLGAGSVLTDERGQFYKVHLSNSHFFGKPKPATLASWVLTNSAKSSGNVGIK
jgi:hypothetical protein